MEQDIIIKFCVVGQPSVGKTSMLYRYVHQKFDDKVRPTIGCDFTTKLKPNNDGKPIRLQLWDIAGQERYNSVSKMYLRGAIGCVVVCSAENKHTLQETVKWKKIIQENLDFGTQTKIPCILVQNKIDLVGHDSCSDYQTKSYLQKFAHQNGFSNAMQSSAKTNTNIEQIFENLLQIATKQGLLRQSTGNNGNIANRVSTKATNKVILQSNNKTTSNKNKCC